MPVPDPAALRALAACLSRYDRWMANQLGNQVALALGCPIRSS
jgi:hypothetical protein